MERRFSCQNKSVCQKLAQSCKNWKSAKPGICLFCTKAFNEQGLKAFETTSEGALRPGVRFSKDLKTSRTQKPSRKAPETTSGVSQSTRKILSPKNTSFSPVNYTGAHYLPKSVFRCFSYTCLIKWRPQTYFLGQNKCPRSCIKRERVEDGRENNVVRKYGFYQNKFPWLIVVNRKNSKHYRVRRESQRNFHTCQAVWSEFDFFCLKFLTKAPKFVQQLSKTVL